MDKLNNYKFICLKIIKNIKIIDVINLYLSNILNNDFILDYLINHPLFNIELMNNDKIPEIFIFKILDKYNLEVYVLNDIIYKRIKSRSKILLDIIDKYILIHGYKDELCWNNISTLSYLSNDFIIKYKNKINWNLMCKYNINLPQYLIEENKQLVNWYYISLYNKNLSLLFIYRNYNNIIPYALMLNNNYNIISRYIYYAYYYFKRIKY